MSIYRTILARGYFPKELPPAFFTDQFAAYATSRVGRRVIRDYKPMDGYTDPASYRAALAGLVHRQLRVPHPASFSALAFLVAAIFKRLLKKASSSPFS